MNFGNALGLSQKLAARYPKSVVAHNCHGRLALMLRKSPEGSGAFRKALLIQPNLAIGYLGLGLTEAWQNRLAAAMSDYRQVTRLAPKADIGWIALSGCAEKLGNKRKALSMRDTQWRLHPLPSPPGPNLSQKKGFSETSRPRQRRPRAQNNVAARPANEIPVYTA